VQQAFAGKPVRNRRGRATVTEGCRALRESDLGKGIDDLIRDADPAGVPEMATTAANSDEYPIARPRG